MYTSLIRSECEEHTQLDEFHVVPTNELSDPEFSIPSKIKSKFTECPPSIHFGACSWGCGFFVGVHRSMEEMWGLNFYEKLISIHGDSAGVFFALGIALGKNSTEMDALYRNLSLRCHIEGISKNSEIVNEALDFFLEDENAYTKVNNKLSIGITTFPLAHKRLWSWESNMELRQCLIASMYLPMYCAPIDLIHGAYVMDGGFSFCGKHFHHGNQTLFIGIDQNAEISIDMSLYEMAFPMVNKKYDDIVFKGWNALKQWDGIYKDKTNNRKKNWSGIILWPLKAISDFRRNCYKLASSCCCCCSSEDKNSKY